MTFDLTFFALAIPAMLLAGMSKGGFGSGFSFAATPILALILPPEMAVGIMLPLLMIMDVSALRPYWRLWSWTDARRLMIGCLPGVAIGALFWDFADPDTIRLLIGGIAIAFVVWQIAKERGLLPAPKHRLGKAAGLAAGAAAGFTSFVSHAGGPPAAVYLLSQGLSKTTYQATTVIVFWFINIAKAVPYAFMGFLHRDTLTAGLLLAPFAILGVFLGVKAHRAIPERAFFRLTYVLLTVTGAKLIWDALA